MTPVSLFSSPAASGTPTGGLPVVPAFKPGQIDTFKFNNAFVDWAESAGYTIIVNGRERAKLFDPFEGAIVQLDHRAPSGTPLLSAVAGSPGITGRFFYAITVVNRSLRDEIESPVIRVLTPIVVTAQRVQVDLSGLTRIWAEATHFAIYRSLDRTVNQTDPFPIFARVGLITISTTIFNDETLDDDLDFTDNSLNIVKGPPPVAPFVEELKSVVFFTGFETITGTGAILVNGSPTLTLPTGRLDLIHIGSDISFGTSERGYRIKDIIIGSPNDTVTLGDEHNVDVDYEGTSDTKDWFVCADPTAVRFSEPEKPFDVPAINEFSVGRGHGRNTGILAARSNLIIAKREEIYVYGFNEFAGFGQSQQISSRIGCVSHRTMSVDEDGTARWLGVGGIAESNGQSVRIISNPVAEKFDEVLYDGSRGDLAPRAVAAHDIVRHEYICFIPTVLADRNIGCREAIVFNYRNNTWAIYELDIEVTAMSNSRDDSGYPIVVFGDASGYVWVWGQGTTDGAGISGNPGTVRGVVDTYVSSPTPLITDNDAKYFKGLSSPNLDLAGAPVRILSGTGAGQIRVIANTFFSPPQLELETKFPVRLDSTSVYGIGIIRADYRSGWMDLGTNDMKSLEYVEVSYYIETVGGVWFLEIFVDQPGVISPTIFTYPNGSLARFTITTDGSDEPTPSGKVSVATVGFRRIKTKNIPFRLMQWRLISPYANAPGTYFNVTPVLRKHDR